VNDAPSNLVLSLTATSILENGSTSLSGSFADVEATDAHTVVINWGDGSANTTIPLAAGTLTIPATTHTYADDNPTGTLSDVYTIAVTVTDNGQSGYPAANDFQSVSATTTVTVNNVAPSNTGSDFTFNPYTGIANASLSFSDPGWRDTVGAAWTGLSGSPVSFGPLAYSGTLTGTSAGTLTVTGCYASAISVVISDDDTGSFSQLFAPANTLGAYTASFMAPIKEGARNIVKLGNVIPVKVNVLDCHGTPVLNRTLQVWLVSGVTAEDIANGENLTEGTSVSSADNGNQMRIADGHYMFNLATKGLKTGVPFTIIIKDIDPILGTQNIATAAIELKK
jgi:hypothetical protein